MDARVALLQAVSREFDDPRWKTDDHPPWTIIFGIEISSPASSSCSKCTGSSRPIQYGGTVLEKNSNAEEMSSLFEGKIAPSWAVALRERFRAETQADADGEGDGDRRT